MNKIMLCTPKQISKISLIFMLLLMPVLVKADIIKVGEIITCYQRVDMDSGKNIKLLNFGGAPTISLSAGPSAGTAFHYFTIRQYNTASSSYHFLSFPPGTGWPFIELNDPDNGGDVRAYLHNYSSLSTLTFSTAESLIITLYAESTDPVTGETIHTVAGQNITIDFVSFEESFDFKTHNQSCFTYDNFQFKKNVTNLEGLCNNPSYELRLPPGAPNTMGLPNNFSRTISFGDFASQSITIPINQEECTNPNYGCQASDPCGCIDFDIDIHLFPCYPRNPNCPEVTTVSKRVTVCCRCGSSTNPDFPTMGRNTPSTALISENSELTIFPNPNQSGKLQIHAPGNLVKSIKVYTVDGRLVKDITIKEPVSNQVSVDISNLPSGVYQVKVLDNADRISNKKLLVQ
jgi:hypothetical protein